MTQPAKSVEYRTRPCTHNKYGTTLEPGRLSGWETESSQFTTTIEIDSGRNYVEFAQMASRPMLTLAQNKCISLLIFSLA
jgi:hypothetical protein